MSKIPDKVKYVLLHNAWVLALLLLAYANLNMHHMTLKGCDDTGLLIKKIIFLIFFFSNLFTILYVTSKSVSVDIDHTLHMIGGFLIFAGIIVLVGVVISLVHMFLHYESYSFKLYVKFLGLFLFLPIGAMRMFFPEGS